LAEESAPVMRESLKCLRSRQIRHPRPSRRWRQPNDRCEARRLPWAFTLDRVGRGHASALSLPSNVRVSVHPRLLPRRPGL